MDELHTQTLMIVSKDDLSKVMKSTLDEVLALHEEQSEAYLTTKDVAKMLSVNRSTLWRWNKTGYLVASRVGNRLRYRLSDVQRILRGEGCAPDTPSQN